MSYTLGEAVRITGKSKSTIGRAIKRDDLSATIEDDGSYRVDPAELSRVYPLVHLEPHAPVAPEPPTPTDATAITVAVLEERVRQLEDRLHDVEMVRDRLLVQNERLTMMLAAPPAEPPQPHKQPPETPQEAPARPRWKFW